jgi:carboxyl-terminal processing protease
VKVATPKQNHFQDTLLQHYAFFNFAKRYTINHQVPKTFTVDEPVMQEFRKFLSEEKVPFTEAELAEVNDWIRSNIKSEIFIDTFGQEEGLKVRAEADPLVQKGLELLPQAKELADNARRVIAERNSARNSALASTNR